MMHTDAATRLTPIALIMVAAASLFAAGVYVIPLKAPTITEPAPQQPANSTDQGTTDDKLAGQTPVFKHTDWTVIAQDLSWLASDASSPGGGGPLAAGQLGAGRTGDLQGVAGSQNASTSTDQNEAPPPPNWRYIGYFAEADRFVALLSVDGKQRLAHAGDIINIYTITDVEPGEVLIRSGAVRHRLPAKVPPVVNLAQRLPRTITPPTRPGGMSPEDYERLRLERLRGVQKDAANPRTPGGAGGRR